MTIISGPRQSGRTTALVKLCAQNPTSVIVSPTKHMAEFVDQTARDMGLKINKTLSFYEYTHERFPRIYDYFYFDDLDLALKILAGSAIVKAITVNDPIIQNLQE